MENNNLVLVSVSCQHATISIKNQFIAGKRDLGIVSWALASVTPSDTPHIDHITAVLDQATTLKSNYLYFPDMGKFTSGAKYVIEVETVNFLNKVSSPKSTFTIQAISGSLIKFDINPGNLTLYRFQEIDIPVTLSIAECGNVVQLAKPITFDISHTFHNNATSVLEFESNQQKQTSDNAVSYNLRIPPYTFEAGSHYNFTAAVVAKNSSLDVVANQQYSEIISIRQFYFEIIDLNNYSNYII